MKVFSLQSKTIVYRVLLVVVFVTAFIGLLLIQNESTPIASADHECTLGNAQNRNSNLNYCPTYNTLPVCPGNPLTVVSYPTSLPCKDPGDVLGCEWEGSPPATWRSVSSCTLIVHDRVLTVVSDGINNVVMTGVHGGTTNPTSYQITGLTPGNAVVTAPLASGPATFVRWTGCSSLSGGSNETCTRTMDANRTVTAEYSSGPITFDLTVNSSGASNVTMTGAQGGVTLPTSYPVNGLASGSNAAVTAPLTVLGRIFTNWVGCSNLGGSRGEICTREMTADRTITANYILSTNVAFSYINYLDGGVTRADQHQIVLRVTGPSTVNPGEIFIVSGWASCNGDDFSGSRGVGGRMVSPSVVNFPNTGTSICPPSNDIDVGTINITAPLTPGPASATFHVVPVAPMGPGAPEVLTQLLVPGIFNYTVLASATYNLDVTSTGASNVIMSGAPATYGGTTGTVSYPKTGITSGTSIDITAPATSGGQNFSSWTVGCDSVGGTGNRTCTVLVNTNKTITANYVASVNNPPNTPSIAATSPIIGTQNVATPNFTFNAGADPDGDQVRYLIDWTGDSVADETLGYLNSGLSNTRSHTFPTLGGIQVRVMAEDINGAFSAWSVPHTITISSGLGTSIGPFNINPSPIDLGNSTNLSWTTSGPISSCRWLDTINGGGIWQLLKPANQPGEPVSPSSVNPLYRYNLECFGTPNPTPTSATVNVRIPLTSCSPNGSGYNWNGVNLWVATGPTIGWNWDPTDVGMLWSQAPPGIPALEYASLALDVEREWMVNYGQLRCATVIVPAPTVTFGVAIDPPGTAFGPSANPVSSGSVRLSLVTANAGSCQRTDSSTAWDMTVGNTSLLQTFNNITVSETYSVSCTGPGGTTPASVTINVGPAPTLGVIASANPLSGTVPLNNVNVSGTISGTASGNIRWEIDCTDDGTFEHDVTNALTTYSNTCSYAFAGLKTARVRVTRQGVTESDTTNVDVSAVVPPRVSLSVNDTQPIAYGATTNLRWITINGTPDSCIAIAGMGAGFDTGNAINSNDDVGPLTGDTTFTIRCDDGATQGVPASIDVAVQPGFGSFGRAPSVVPTGGSTFATWSILHDDPTKVTCERNLLSGNGSGWTSAGGSLSHTGLEISGITLNSSYQLKCFNNTLPAYENDSVGGTLGVSVVAPFANISALPEQVLKGRGTTLVWEAQFVTGACDLQSAIVPPSGVVVETDYGNLLAARTNLANQGFIAPTAPEVTSTDTNGHVVANVQNAINFRISCPTFDGVGIASNITISPFIPGFDEE